MHSHLLPGIDDGAPDLAESLTLIRALLDLGFAELYTTPHVMSDLYPNSRDTILRKRDELLEAVAESGLEVRLDAAAEYYIDTAFTDRLIREPLLTLPGNRVLVEQSMMQPYPNLDQVLFDLQMKGYQPVLAHPERYAFYRHAEQILELADRGIELQVNLLSLSGYYGTAARKMAKALIEAGVVSFVGTDLHHIRHAKALAECLKEPMFVRAAAQAANPTLSTSG
ncbi:MAG: CpsB/CapC family capsule biosynthesis tyrosine phosphatase [Saprospiraceae bacterium]|nr:CpsB/CapC family capsule biosynthesis tyrosine phosphatase [Saprospiraceae bacterium]